MRNACVFQMNTSQEYVQPNMFLLYIAVNDNNAIFSSVITNIFPWEFLADNNTHD